jgi:hypothetical protein
MIKGTLVLTPAYGKDYVTEDEAKTAWNAGEDFIIRTLEVRGTYASIRDLEAIKEKFRMVYIRFNKEMDTVTVYEEN